MTLSLLQIHEQYFKALPEAEEHFISLADGVQYYYILENAYVIDDKMFCKVTVEIPLLFTSRQSSWELNYGPLIIFTENYLSYLWSTLLFRNNKGRRLGTKYSFTFTVNLCTLPHHSFSVLTGIKNTPQVLIRNRAISFFFL